MQKTNTLENNIVDESLQGSLVDTTKECVSSDLKDENKFRSIDMKTVKMIIEQAMGYEEQCATYTSELYNEDVQLVSKDGRLYYLPE